MNQVKATSKMRAIFTELFSRLVCVCVLIARVCDIFSSLIDQYFGGSFQVEMKCTESEDEIATSSKENFLQLSCFISQDVKYMLSGIRSVCSLNIVDNHKFIAFNWTHIHSFDCALYLFIETPRAIDEAIPIIEPRCSLLTYSKSPFVLRIVPLIFI